MRRKITVYGLRFSKTTFVDHINTGFLDPAVATVPTACGIETEPGNRNHLQLVQVATVPTACGIETLPMFYGLYYPLHCCNSTYRLRY